MKNLFLTLLFLLLVSCSASKKVTVENTERKLLDNQTFLLTKISKDKTYGYSEKNAVQVGGSDKREGPLNERRFLNALAGPNGEKVSYYRAGSCCPVKSEKGLMGVAPLDNYRVTWEGSKDTVSIYINMYDYGELMAPVGFTIKRIDNFSNTLYEDSYGN
ncbi:MAG TPA: 2-dehydro-3-deoxyphosphooctonate aldolase [Dysgonomonas sp.]|nr:2-dehydro-3-deoxyphosphooctonate aldolase [Dysgonomonas sp.]